MQLVDIRELNRGDLKQYLDSLHDRTPFYFDTDFGVWEKDYFDLDGDLFCELEGKAAVRDDGRIVGIVMYGKPRRCWNRRGEFIELPNIGIIREIYFDQDETAAGEQLLAEAMAYVSRCDDYHAFYHAFGLPSMAGHGKLAYSWFGHVEKLILDRHFAIEHENLYFAKEIGIQPVDGALRLEIAQSDDLKRERITAFLDAREIGTAEVKLMDRYTGTTTKDAVYLTWIGIHEEFRGRGYGAKFLNGIENEYAGRGYARLHLDTANNNTIARQLYMKRGYRHLCSTRSYFKISV